MLWEIEIYPKGADTERKRVCAEYDLLTNTKKGTTLIHKATRGYVVVGALEHADVERLMTTLLVDPLVETALVTELPEPRGGSHHGTATLHSRFEMATV